MAPMAFQTLSELFPKYLESQAYRVIIEPIDRLLTIKWDHIFFTGSQKTGRIIAETAARLQTGVSTELEVKSPLYIDAENANMSLAAKRVLWGKQLNEGQVSRWVVIERGLNLLWMWHRYQLPRNMSSSLGLIKISL